MVCSGYSYNLASTPIEVSFSCKSQRHPSDSCALHCSYTGFVVFWSGWAGTCESESAVTFFLKVQHMIFTSCVLRRLLAAAIVATTIQYSATARAADFDREKLEHLHSAMQKYVDDKSIAGAVAAIGSREGIVITEAVGSLNREQKLPMDTDAVFRIASMTKPITAIAIMMLTDEGKLAVDDPVEKHLPEFKDQLLIESNRNGIRFRKKMARLARLQRTLPECRLPARISPSIEIALAARL